MRKKRERAKSKKLEHVHDNRIILEQETSNCGQQLEAQDFWYLIFELPVIVGVVLCVIDVLLTSKGTLGDSFKLPDRMHCAGASSQSLRAEPTTTLNNFCSSIRTNAVLCSARHFLMRET